MQELFSLHNSHLENPQKFVELDPQLRKLKNVAYVYHAPLIDKLPTNTPGIYTLGGGRQIGKTTLLKQWILALLQAGILPNHIVFFTGEIIDDHHRLIEILQTYLAKTNGSDLHYIIIDEINYIAGWDKGIKFLADAGLLQNAIVILTGSDLALIHHARMTFPGRRGDAAVLDFHYYPLSFYECIKLTDCVPEVDALAAGKKPLSPSSVLALTQAFNQYLSHGGFLTAINDQAKHGHITSSCLKTYSDWIRGDVLKRGKQERYLKEILSGLIKRYNTQISFNTLAKDLTIDHPNTVADYCLLLETMDAIYIQHAILEDKLLAAPKKAKKIIFTDPFIYHAVNAWVSGDTQTSIENTLSDPIIVANLVENCVVNHFRRAFPTYYIKAEGEVDIAYVKHNIFVPIEIKWTNQIRPKDLKQILKYTNGAIWSKSEGGHIHGKPILFLPLELLKLL